MMVRMVLQKIRDDGRLKNFEKNFRELQEIVDVLSRASPFVGRIVAKKQTYPGKVEKIKLNDGQLEFTAIECNRDGETNDNSKIHQERITLENLLDIEVLYKKDKPLFLDDLLNDHKMEKKNE